MTPAGNPQNDSNDDPHQGRFETEDIPGSDSNATSMSLLYRIKAHDQSAWDRLVLLYAPLVHYWCRRQNLAEQDIADVFQDVFQSVASKIEAFRKELPGDTFRGWLRTITRNKVLDHFRRVGREPQATGGTDANLKMTHVAGKDAREDQEEDGEIYQQIVRQALDSIQKEFTPKTWRAFWRVAIDGQTPLDVAAELSMRPGAIRVAKSRVLHRLRQELGDLID